MLIQQPDCCGMGWKARRDVAVAAGDLSTFAPCYRTGCEAVTAMERPGVARIAEVPEFNVCYQG